MTLEMQVKKLLGINAVQNIMAKFQYYYTVSDYDAIGKLFYESDTTSAEVPGGKYVGIQEIRTKAFGGFPGGPMPKPEGGEGKPEAPEGEGPKGPAGPVNMGGGRLQIHTLTTPLVEVADDCKTAKALWMSPGLETGGHVGDLAGSWAWEKFYVEFICEDD